MRALGLLSSLLRVLLVLALATSPALALADRASAARVAPVVTRVLLYERTLAARAGDHVDVLVLHTSAAASAGEARGLEEAFASMGAVEVQGIPVRVTRAEYSAGRLAQELAGGVDVVLVASGLEAQASAIAEATRRRHVVTIGTTRAFAENGVMLAVFMQEGRPRIAVNMAQVRAAGTQLSAQLLRLCEVL